jgi:hypothetical protein
MASSRLALVASESPSIVQSLAHSTVPCTMQVSCARDQPFPHSPEPITMTHSTFPTPHALMLKDFPDHHDAELVLRVYELRREPVMRESRSKINSSQFMPKRYEDVEAVRKMDHPLNAAFRQTSTYWEMVYGLARHGIVHADFLVENNGEGLILLAKMFPFLERYRKDTSARSFANAEWIATQSELGREVFARHQERVEKQRTAQ